jgi:hypothetical protein
MNDDVTQMYLIITESLAILRAIYKEIKSEIPSRTCFEKRQSTVLTIFFKSPEIFKGEENFLFIFNSFIFFLNKLNL